MKLITAAAFTLAALCQNAMAVQPEDYDNLYHQPAKFCLVAGVIATFIMERRNRGEPIEYLYDEASQLKPAELKTYMLETVSLSTQFPPMTPGKQFGQWRYEQCMQAMKD